MIVSLEMSSMLGKFCFVVLWRNLLYGNDVDVVLIYDKGQDYKKEVLIWIKTKKIR